MRRLLLEVAVAAASASSHLPHVPMDTATPLPYAIATDVKPAPHTPVLTGSPRTSSPSASPMLGGLGPPRAGGTPSPLAVVGRPVGD